VREMGTFRLSVKIDSNIGAVFKYTCMSNTLDSATSGIQTHRSKRVENTTRGEVF